MDEKHFKILQFLSGQENPIKFDKFPDTIKSLFRQNTIQDGSLIHELGIVLSNKLWVKKSKDLQNHFYITDLGNSELVNEINRQKSTHILEKSMLDLAIETAHRKNQLGLSDFPLADRLPTENPNTQKNKPKNSTLGKISKHWLIKLLTNKTIDLILAIIAAIIATIWLVKHKWM